MLYVADFSVLEGLEAQPGKYCGAPIMLFLACGDRPLRVVAVQVSQRHGNDRVWTPSNSSEEDWLAVKICALSAAAHVYFFGYRLLYCNLCMEPFVLATLRCLPDQHPLYKLLHPHMVKGLASAAQAREMMEPDSPVLRAFALTASSVKVLQERMFSKWRLDSCHDCQYNIQVARGMADLPGFAFREQVCDLWDVLQGHVQGLLHAMYACCYDDDPTAPSDATVRLLNDDATLDDPEAREWLDELARGLRRAGWQHLFTEPRSRNIGIQDLADICTCYVWTVTVLNTSLTHTMWDTFGWPAAAPLALYDEPPHARARVSSNSPPNLFRLLPSRQMSAYQVVLVWFLSRGAQMVDLDSARRHSDVLEHPTAAAGAVLPLGWWNEDILVLPELRKFVNDLRETLEQVSIRLQSVRPHGAPARHPDVFPVDPRMIPNSLLPVSRRAHPAEDRLPGQTGSGVRR
eukprot:Hpha_TRINITY_DN6879_c0_g1::TRINITY_DN6879_c0_g1_i1::g.46042::m.46042/K00461/ALOX5; arachidonate 5-lipoxygenase